MAARKEFEVHAVAPPPNSAAILPRNLVLIIAGVTAGICIGFSGSWLAAVGGFACMVGGMAIENGVGR